MPTPHEKAMMLRNTWEKENRDWPEDVDDLPVIEAFSIFNEDKGFADSFIKIRLDGWVTLGDSVCEGFPQYAPEDFEKLCKWYLGIE